MYETRPLSYYKKNPDVLLLPPEGPNSGYLVIQDEESETYCCCGLCKDYDILDLPLPQDKKLTVQYEVSTGQSVNVSRDEVVQAFTCSKEEDKQTCCFCRCVRDVKSKQLDPEEAYQQFEICLYETGCNAKGNFFAKSLAPDSFPPYFLRRNGWHLCAETPKNYELNDDALGLNSELRQQLPEFNFTPSSKSSEVVVGKWYCPFRSMFYEMTLEQRWEQFFTCQNDQINEGNSVLVDVAVDTEVVLLAGTNKATWDDKNIKIVQRMKWEQERAGWENQGRVKRVEQNSSGWRRFSCNVLFERFVLRRMDRSLVMTYGFKHIEKVKSIWE
ncbi:unnamed protein product [Withania somnifera]